MTDRDALLQQLADDVRELTEPRRHTEPYRSTDPATRRVRWLAHTTEQPSLLDQLRAGGAGGAAAAGDGGGTGRGFESKPPAGLDCLDRLLAIEAGSAWWVSVVWRAPLRETVEANLRALVGLTTHPDTALTAVMATVADVHRWLGWASVLTGWKTPPWRPRATCPACARRDGLRVRLDDKQAACLLCGATWDAATIGLLADHIRTEGDAPGPTEEVPVDQA